MFKALIACALVLQASSFGATTLCAKTAKAAVLKQFGSYFYYKGRPIRTIHQIRCGEQKSKAGSAYVSCDVYGDGIDTPGAVSFRVLENKACTRAFRAWLTAEE